MAAPLAPGTKLGPYEIAEPIGAGGMGAVYRARDSRLDRDVAIKVSTAQFNERFLTEARAIAALNHPNICSLFDIGPDYLVLELVEGPTLADRLKQGPLGLEESLAIAGQIAAALEAAHEKGITHRDLKPGNIKIKPGGLVKVLDFGLAKIQSGPTPASSNPDESPTLTLQATSAGMILGTAGYMSPEQARGEPVDKRADIWSYGVVLHEMLTAKSLFQGPTVADTLAAVLVKVPDLAEVPAKTRPLLAACLERNLQRRLRDIGDAARLLEVPEVTVAAPAPRKTAWLPWSLAGLAALMAGAVSYSAFTRPKPVQPLARLEIPVPEAVSAKVLEAGGSLIGTRISPDGATIAIHGPAGIWLRRLEDPRWRFLEGTAGATTVIWAPDSQQLAFTTAEALMKVPLAGGLPQTIVRADGSASYTGFWTRDGQIVFRNRRGIHRVHETGGAVTKLADGISPAGLPDDVHFGYSAVGDGFVFSSLREPAMAQKLLGEPLPTATFFVRDAKGKTRALYLRRPNTGQPSSLLAQEFDERKFELRGAPVTLAEEVTSFSPSSIDTLVYQPSTRDQNEKRILTWIDRQGKTVGTAGEPRGYGLAQKAAVNGNRVLVRLSEDRTGDFWLYDLSRALLTRLTTDGGDYIDALWSAQGTHVFLSRREKGGTVILRRKADGSGSETVLFRGERGQHLQIFSVSSDGRYLFHAPATAKTRGDIWVLPLEDAGPSYPYLITEMDEWLPMAMPSGRQPPKWIAYVSKHSGRDEIYVQAFDPANKTGTPAGERWQVSSGGGRSMHWRPDGKELFYHEYTSGNMMAAPVLAAEGSTFRTGPARVLFKAPPDDPRFTISADGLRFLFAVPVGGPAAKRGAPPYVLLQNWSALLDSGKP